jgi:hypothetical protein
MFLVFGFISRERENIYTPVYVEGWDFDETHGECNNEHKRSVCFSRIRPILVDVMATAPFWFSPPKLTNGCTWEDERKR